MMDLLIIGGAIVSLLVLAGVVPVIFRKDNYYEHGVNWNANTIYNTITSTSTQSSVTNSHLSEVEIHNADIDIEQLSFQLSNNENANFDEFNIIQELELLQEQQVQEASPVIEGAALSVSEPTEDMEDALSQLITQVQSSIKNVEETLNYENALMEEEVLPSLEYNFIVERFGEKVANLITATPFTSFVGVQHGIHTIIGRVVVGENSENVSLYYGGEKIELKGLVPPVDNEVFLVKGSFVSENIFQVIAYGDPKEIAAGGAWEPIAVVS